MNPDVRIRQAAESIRHVIRGAEPPLFAVRTDRHMAVGVSVALVVVVSLFASSTLLNPLDRPADPTSVLLTTVPQTVTTTEAIYQTAVLEPPALTEYFHRTSSDAAYSQRDLVTWVTTIEDLLPSTEVHYVDGPRAGVEEPGGRLIVGRITGVERGRGVVWNFDGEQDAKKYVEFDSPSAAIHTVHAIVEPLEDLSGAETEANLKVGLAVGDLAFETVQSELTSMGTVLLVLGPDWSLFEYDRNIGSIGWGGLLLGTIGSNGKVDFPFMGGEFSQFADRLLHGATLDELREAAKMPRTVTVKIAGAAYFKILDPPYRCEDRFFHGQLVVEELVTTPIVFAAIVGANQQDHDDRLTDEEAARRGFAVPMSHELEADEEITVCLIESDFRPSIPAGVTTADFKYGLYVIRSDGDTFTTIITANRLTFPPDDGIDRIAAEVAKIYEEEAEKVA